MTHEKTCTHNDISSKKTVLVWKQPLQQQWYGTGTSAMLANLGSDARSASGDTLLPRLLNFQITAANKIAPVTLQTDAVVMMSKLASAVFPDATAVAVEAAAAVGNVSFVIVPGAAVFAAEGPAVGDAAAVAVEGPSAIVIVNAVAFVIGGAAAVLVVGDAAAVAVKGPSASVVGNAVAFVIDGGAAVVFVVGVAAAFVIGAPIVFVVEYDDVVADVVADAAVYISTTL
jgi:hypothetical protein